MWRWRLYRSGALSYTVPATWACSFVEYAVARFARSWWFRDAQICLRLARAVQVPDGASRRGADAGLTGRSLIRIHSPPAGCNDRSAWSVSEGRCGPSSATYTPTAVLACGSAVGRRPCGLPRTDPVDHRPRFRILR